jgi:hypothetical protein
MQLLMLGYPVGSLMGGQVRHDWVTPQVKVMMYGTPTAAREECPPEESIK